MGSRGSKINNPWNREGGEGNILLVILCLCRGEGGWGEGGM